LSASDGPSSPAANRDLLTASHTIHSDTNILERKPSTSIMGRSMSSSRTIKDTGNGVPVFVKKIRVTMYSFGAPRVGNFGFKQLYDKNVPHSFRVVVDGDLVAGLPPSGYDHIGTEILIDSLGAGSVIIDPSFVERWLRTHLKSSVTVHSLLYYRKGLLGLKLSAQYLKEYAEEIKSENLDPLRLAVLLRNTHKIEKLVEAQEDLPDVLNTLRKNEEETLLLHADLESLSEKSRAAEELNVAQDKIAMRDLSPEEPVQDTLHPSLPVSVSSEQVQSSDFSQLPGSRSPSTSQQYRASTAEEPNRISVQRASTASTATFRSPLLSMSSQRSPPHLTKFASERSIASSATVNTLHGNGDTVNKSGEGAPISPPPVQNPIDKSHYEHDVRNMNELLSQINTLKKTGSIEEWFKKNTIQRFQRKKNPEETPQNAMNQDKVVIVGTLATQRVIRSSSTDAEPTVMIVNPSFEPAIHRSHSGDNSQLIRESKTGLDDAKTEN
jgi:hypothetical protein